MSADRISVAAPRYAHKAKLSVEVAAQVAAPLAVPNHYSACMPVFQGGPQTTEQLLPSPFANERELQTFFERNLDTLLGVRFVASEFATGEKHGGRIDTLGLDEGRNPVIIEYKWEESASVCRWDLRRQEASVGAMMAVSGRAKRTLIDIVDVLAGDEMGAVVVRERLSKGTDESDVQRVILYRVADNKIIEAWLHDQDQRLVDRFWQRDDSPEA